jgi:hypothetical protein
MSRARTGVTNPCDLTAEAADPAAWLSPVTLSDEGVAAEPVVATAADGSVTAAWQQVDGYRQRIATRSKAAGQTEWGLRSGTKGPSASADGPFVLLSLAGAIT